MSRRAATQSGMTRVGEADFAGPTTYPRESHRVSHETIYRSLFIQARGSLKKESSST